MALSQCQARSGPVWPLGCVVVPSPGTPVNIMFNVDPQNNNAPGTAYGPGTPVSAGVTPTCHKIFIQGVHPGANNNGMVLNSGNIYLMVAPQGGPGNRSDSGAIAAVIFPGSGSTWPANEMELDTVSPYSFWVDADSANDGALITLQI
jgi:hypothetical protein